MEKMDLKNKTITLTLPIYLLYKELERLRNTLDFTVFFVLEQTFEAPHIFTPAFDFEEEYFEIQENSVGVLKVLSFGFRAYKEIGDELSDEDVMELVNKLKNENT
jgi:hypothetical protein